MKIIFAGTPEFALPAFKMLLANSSHHQVVAVYTQPDRPAGRGQKLTASPVKSFAVTCGLSVYQPTTLKTHEAQKVLKDLNADLLVNVAYGLLLPSEIINAPKFGCINIHPSLLPRFRGAAPIQRAILSGDQITGVSIMKMDSTLDTGDIYKQKTLPITATDSSATLLNKTATFGAEMLLEALSEIEKGTAKLNPQDNSQATYANKISKEEGKINWQKGALEIDRMVRAFNPWPVAFTKIAGKYMRVWQTAIIDEPLNLKEKEIKEAIPGTIVAVSKNGVAVMTQKDILWLIQVQFAGDRARQIADLINDKKNGFVVGQLLS